MLGSLDLNLTVLCFDLSLDMISKEVDRRLQLFGRFLEIYSLQGPRPRLIICLRAFFRLYPIELGQFERVVVSGRQSKRDNGF